MDEYYLGTVALRIYSHIIDFKQQDMFRKHPTGYVKGITMGGPHEPLAPDAIEVIVKKIENLLS